MKILVIAHAHPDFSLGGGEIAAHTLFREYRNHDDVTDAFYLGRIDKGRGAIGTITKRRENEYLWEQTTSNLMEMSAINHESLINDFSDFITEVSPDVIHLHHYLNLGLEIIPILKSIRPQSKIILTLHEFVAICENNGQMIKTNGKGLCYKESYDDCAKCFPGRTPTDFWIRKNNYLNHFKYIDFFISPSIFLLERYIEWGISRDKIMFIENGHAQHKTRIRELENSEQRNRLGFFGQINLYKGLDVVLEALDEADPKPNIILEINGANLETQPEEFQIKVKTLLSRLTEKGLIQINGAYSPEKISERMNSIDWVLVPSIWWENSPMVIQEAFSFGKPVVCSDIGGMKEKVTHGVNGLHVSYGNKKAWISVLKNIASNSTLWNTLHKGISPPLSHREIAEMHMQVITNLE